MKYFLEVITLSQVILHEIDKRNLSSFYNEHPNAKCIDEKEYLRLIKTSPKFEQEY